MIIHLRSSGGLFGADKVVLSLCENLPSQGFPCLLVPLLEADGSGDAFLEEAKTRGIPVAPIHLRHPMDLPALYRLRKLARDAGATLLHGHDYKSNLTMLLARGPWKRVTTLHGKVGASRSQRVKEYLDIFSANRCDRVICVSEGQAKIERKRGIRNATVVLNGIDPRPFQVEANGLQPLRESLGLAPNEQVIGSIGRLSEEKGCDVLLRACARLIWEGRVFKILLVGEGPKENSLRELALKLGIEKNLLLPGFQKNTAQWYGLLNVFCMPSRREGLPLALLEAMASSRAIVASDVGGIPEVVGRDGNCGLCVPSEDEPGLAAALDRLLSHPEQRAAMGRAAQARVSEAFSHASMARGVAKVYQTLL